MAEQVESKKTVRSMQGMVSSKTEKSIVVKIVRQVMHEKYKKIVKKTTKIMAHDPENVCHVGDVVRIIESRPISKRKRWCLDTVVREVRA